MIQANELRIGNWLISAKTDEPFQVDCIPNDAPITATPIPLTEDVLLKCGFVKVNSTWFAGRLSKFRLNIAFDVEFQNHWLGIRLKHLHNLQNLYFALTNQELQINL